MKRLVIVAALLALAACKTNDTGKTTTTDTTSTSTTTPAMAPAADTGMKKDTGSMKMNMDTAMKTANTMADTAAKMGKKGKAAMKKSM